MKIVSWNVNGLRACVKKGFLEFLEASQADVVALQEVRAFPAQLEPHARTPPGWHAYFFPAARAGYSGVAIYSRMPADRVTQGFGIEEFDIEGRFLAVHFGRTSVASVYFPKGSGTNRDNSRVEYKMAFYSATFDAIEKMRRYGPTFVGGDYNTAHTQFDLARPKANTKTSGFLPEERAEFDRWVAAGWVDVFRKRHRDEPGHYTWWRQWGNAREDNVGWRIDYVMASPSAAKRVTDAFIWPQITGSDHCPIGVTVKD